MKTNKQKTAEADGINFLPLFLFLLFCRITFKTQIAICIFRP